VKRLAVVGRRSISSIVLEVLPKFKHRARSSAKVYFTADDKGDLTYQFRIN